MVVVLVAACGPAIAPVEGDTATDGDASSTGMVTTNASQSTHTGMNDATTLIETSAASDTASTGGPEPLPPGGLGPWGYAFEVLDIDAAEVLLADFDADGHVDVFAQGPLAGEDAQLWLELGSGQGLDFVAGPPSVVAWAGAPVAGDFDGDGRLDVAAPTYGGIFHVALNVGGAFPESVQSTGDDLWPAFGVAVLDVDGDGAQDIFISGGHSAGGYVYRSDGAGAFALDHQVVERPACYFSAMTTGDFDGDGSLEVAGSGSCNAIPEVLPIATYRVMDGMLTIDQMFAEGPGIVESGDLVTVDIDLDGDLDLVTGSWPTGLTILHGDVAKGFGAPFGTPYAWEGAAYRVLPVRLTVDGLPAFVLGDADGAYAIAEQTTEGDLVTTPVDLEGRVVGAADFNEDGRTDVAVLTNENEAFGTLAIWLSQ